MFLRLSLILILSSLDEISETLVPETNTWWKLKGPSRDHPHSLRLQVTYRRSSVKLQWRWTFGPWRGWTAEPQTQTRPEWRKYRPALQWPPPPGVNLQQDNETEQQSARTGERRCSLHLCPVKAYNGHNCYYDIISVQTGLIKTWKCTLLSIKVHIRIISYRSKWLRKLKWQPDKPKDNGSARTFLTDSV